MEKQINEKWKKNLNHLLVDSIVHPNKADYTSIGYYYDTEAPKSLYKYYADNEQNTEAIFNNKMWYSAPICFNDPYDCDFAIDESATIKSLLCSIARETKMKKGSVAWRNAYIATKKEFPSLIKTFDSMKSSMGVACLSESSNAMLMWSHYANNHKGMCVEYRLIDFVKKLNFSPIPVIYSKEKSVLKSLRLNSIDSDVTEFFIKSIVYKDIAWEYENEWRIVRDSNACGKQWDSEKHGALLDSIQPASVILGCNAKNEFEEYINAKCKSKGIRVYKMVKGKANYGMSRIEL